MNVFWTVLGSQYCLENDYKYIKKSDKIDDENKMLHEPSLVIINTDDSGSMHWRKFDNAVTGGQACLKYLKDHHTNHESVQVQLWMNTCQGVSCCYKRDFNVEIENKFWTSAHYQ